MAGDNVLIRDGLNEPIKIAADEVIINGTSVQYQYVKLVNGESGSSGIVSAGSNGLKVDCSNTAETPIYVELISGPPASWSEQRSYSAATTGSIVKAADPSKRYYITDIFITNGANAGIIAIGQGYGEFSPPLISDTSGLAIKVYAAPYGGASLNLKNPIKMDRDTSYHIYLISSGVTDHSVTLVGYSVDEVV